MKLRSRNVECNKELDQLGLLDEENQDEFDKNLKEGRELAANGDFESAAARFSLCIQINNEKVEIYKKRACCYLRIQKEEEALKDFETALSLEPNDVIIIIQRANLISSYDLETAISECKRALAIEPENELVKKYLAKFIAIQHEQEADQTSNEVSGCLNKSENEEGEDDADQVEDSEGEGDDHDCVSDSEDVPDARISMEFESIDIDFKNQLQVDDFFSKLPRLKVTSVANNNCTMCKGAPKHDMKVVRKACKNICREQTCTKQYRIQTCSKTFKIEVCQRGKHYGKFSKYLLKKFFIVTYLLKYN
jgi:tetratricopeptide (TPR) repeat protein